MGYGAITAQAPAVENAAFRDLQEEGKRAYDL
jgi:hypothetical protein